MGIELSDVKILAPIPEPVRNIICVGKNYKDHIKEVAKTVDDMNDIPTYPIYFSKMFDRILG
ncbi:MAG TPA: hydrolase, partial [Clostridiaceae bacterium]|nr:hydrolase [Clostridiaceae bacterium]